MVVSLEPRAIMTTGAQTAGDIPITLERSEVPRYFRQFRDATALKKLAHARFQATSFLVTCTSFEGIRSMGRRLSACRASSRSSWGLLWK